MSLTAGVGCEGFRREIVFRDALKKPVQKKEGEDVGGYLDQAGEEEDDVDVGVELWHME